MTLFHFLTGGVGCPALTRRGGVGKEISMQFIMGRSNGLSGFRIIGNIRPCLSGRTLHITGLLPCFVPTLSGRNGPIHTCDAMSFAF